MASELQQLIDRLGARLGRSIALDDTSLKLLAYTSHQGPVDAARVASIMQREVSVTASEYVRGMGALEATDLFEVPSHEELGFAIPRIAMPIRFENTLLGFLWLLESEGPVEPPQADILRETATSVAIVLHRHFLLGEIERHRERELTRDLLSNDHQLRVEAADLMADEDLLLPGTTTAIAVTLQPTRGESHGDRARLAIAVALEQVRRRVPAGRAVQMERPDHGILLLSEQGKGSDSFTTQIATALHDRVCAEVKALALDCWVGIGQRRTGLVAAADSYSEARKAMDAAREVGALGNVVHYRQLGVYGLLSMLDPADLQNSLHPGVERLRSQASSRDFLTETLEAYLDNAGSVKRTSAQLLIQPASLYYRLKRIEELAEVDLRSGNDRLALHQSLKIAHLLGWF